MKVIIEGNGKERKEMDIPVCMTFGERLREIRKAKGLSQKEISEEMGFTSYQGYARYETRERAPKGTTLKKLAEILDVPEAVLDPSPKGFDTPLDFEYDWIRRAGLENSRQHLQQEPGRLAAARILMEGLNEAGQRAALDLLELVCKIPEYKKE